VSEVDVGGRRIDPELDSEGPVPGQLLREPALRQRLDRPLEQGGNAPGNR
jgi:hypothetical protein